MRLFSSFFHMPLAALLLGGLMLGGCIPLQPTQPSSSVSSSGQSQVDTWLQGLNGLSPLEQARRAEAVWSNTASPQALRERAAFLVSTRPSSQALAAQQALSRDYAAASLAQKMLMEQTLMADLLTTDDNALRLSSRVPLSQEGQFPWTLIVWRAAKRGLLANNAATLQRLASPALYADPSLVGLAAASQNNTQAVRPGSSGCVALLLPLSGPVSSIGQQVADGANMARQYLSTHGVNMDVRIIDTARPDWLDHITALPAVCVSMGGPLLADSYIALKSRPLPDKVLFAFLPQLPTTQANNPAAQAAGQVAGQTYGQSSGQPNTHAAASLPGSPVHDDEGVNTWRFFTSPQDQINAVISFASRDMGVTSFGVLAPAEPYGQRMTDLFLQSAQQRGLGAVTASYPPTDMGAWTKISGQFVDAVTPEKGKIPKARASFEAVFLPDSWKNMDMLISTMHYHGASNKIMLGTALWEQGLASARNLNASTYALSVFPGVWNPGGTGPAATALRNALMDRAVAGGSTQYAAPDWAVLGFDFVQFASALNLKERPTAQALNSRLAAGLSLDWAGAPMHWNAQGKASRSLFLLQPMRNGVMPVNQEAFRQFRAGAGPAPNLPPPAPSMEQDTLSPANTPEPDITDLLNSITQEAAPSQNTPVTEAPAPQAGSAQLAPTNSPSSNF